MWHQRKLQEPGVGFTTPRIIASAEGNILDFLKCKYILSVSGKNVYSVITLPNNVGVLYVTKEAPWTITGQLRVRATTNGSYPYGLLKTIDYVFGPEDNTIEVCSGKVSGQSCFTVDVNPKKRPTLVADGQDFNHLIGDRKFKRWRCDPPYNIECATGMYGTDLPNVSKLLKEANRVCEVGSFMFLLLGHVCRHGAPKGMKVVGWVPMSVLPNNELRALHIYHKFF